MNTLNATSRERLKGVDYDMVSVVERVCTYTDERLKGLTIQVTEGVRTLERQKVLFAARKSKTMNSRHLTGDAVDLHVVNDSDGKANWKPRFYDYLNDLMTKAALEIGVEIIWGGDWDGDGDRTDQTFNDLCHWQKAA